MAQFTLKLMNMLQEHEGKGMMYDNGAIVFEAPQEIIEAILHNYFRHAHWTSFQRQLNYFGFKKISGGRMGYKSKVVYFNQELAGKPVSAVVACRKRHATNKPAEARSLSPVPGGRPRSPVPRASNGEDAAAGAGGLFLQNSFGGGSGGVDGGGVVAGTTSPATSVGDDDVRATEGGGSEWKEESGSSNVAYIAPEPIRQHSMPSSLTESCVLGSPTAGKVAGGGGRSSAATDRSHSPAHTVSAATTTTSSSPSSQLQRLQLSSPALIPDNLLAGAVTTVSAGVDDNGNGTSNNTTTAGWLSTVPRRDSELPKLTPSLSTLLLASSQRSSSTSSSPSPSSPLSKRSPVKSFSTSPRPVSANSNSICSKKSSRLGGGGGVNQLYSNGGHHSPSCAAEKQKQQQHKQKHTTLFGLFKEGIDALEEDDDDVANFSDGRAIFGDARASIIEHHELHEHQLKQQQGEQSRLHSRKSLPDEDVSESSSSVKPFISDVTSRSAPATLLLPGSTSRANYFSEQWKSHQPVSQSVAPSPIKFQFNGEGTVNSFSMDAQRAPVSSSQIVSEAQQQQPRGQHKRHQYHHDHHNHQHTPGHVHYAPQEGVKEAPAVAQSPHDRHYTEQTEKDSNYHHDVHNQHHRNELEHRQQQQQQPPPENKGKHHRRGTSGSSMILDSADLAQLVPYLLPDLTAAEEMSFNHDPSAGHHDDGDDDDDDDDVDDDVDHANDERSELSILTAMSGAVLRVKSEAARDAELAAAAAAAVAAATPTGRGDGIASRLNSAAGTGSSAVTPSSTSTPLATSTTMFPPTSGPSGWAVGSAGNNRFSSNNNNMNDYGNNGHCHGGGGSGGSGHHFRGHSRGNSRGGSMEIDTELQETFGMLAEMLLVEPGDLDTNPICSY